jgi:hypothetical protein
MPLIQGSGNQTLEPYSQHLIFIKTYEQAQQVKSVCYCQAFLA